MGTSRQRLRVAKGYELPKVVRYQRMQGTKMYEIPRVTSIKGYEDQRVPMTKGCIVIPRMQCIVIPRMQCIVIQDLRSCRDPRVQKMDLVLLPIRQKDFGLCMSQERPDVYPYPFKDFSKVTYVCGDGWLND
ncbi:hypothetical protein DY000_02051928 [Brassica cretica]|uniref:Uncharacterized protein n=1 Tax=Brassica cretica TaxID=69181 RepID=A0ABQ7AGJ5_BRACR|nr:hypothetical protein DY000_02051928 [Brassica cretica]